MDKPLQIAIDGPVGSGKSDISGRLAKELGLTYLYTGAMYRALAWICVREGVSFKDVPNVFPLLSKYSINLRPPAKDGSLGFAVWVGDTDVTDKLFTPAMSQGSSDVSTIPEVRKFMVARQQELVRGKSVVMEGRDIGLRVLPNAQLKIYLTASLEERARRRWEQYKTKDPTKTLVQEIEETKIRDTQDTSRAADPLQKLPDAWELNTTDMTQDAVVSAIIAELGRRKLI
ncbi:MAG: (d)CMP kinase [Candidatus Gottesmanbacteria bacterium]|nr:(d)CMP kinase [Candidatus Gottesmanbacteria bacterium]